MPTPPTEEKLDRDPSPVTSLAPHLHANLIIVHRNGLEVHVAQLLLHTRLGELAPHKALDVRDRVGHVRAHHGRRGAAQVALAVLERHEGTGEVVGGEDVRT